MTVNKVGRPSKAVERRAAILQAALAVVARDGLAETTMSAVAEQAGLQRALVFHYFGDRAALIDALLDHVVAAYGDLQILGDRTRSLERRLSRAFEIGHYATRDDLVVWTELVALAARDEQIRQRVGALWQQRWLPLIEEELRVGRPHAPMPRVRSVAYGIACLVEGFWTLQLQGLDSPQRRRQAQQGAQLLLASLTGADGAK